MTATCQYSKKVVKMSSWSKYYNILSKNQKDKYDAIQKKFYDALAIEKTRSNEFDELFDKLKESQKYKYAEEFYNDKVQPFIKSGRYCNNPEYDEAHKIYRDLRDDAKCSIVGLEASRIIYGTACDTTRRYKAQMEKFRSAVYCIIDLPEPKGIPTDDPERQCNICCVNIKDHAINCGHVFCIECITKMKCECPSCKKNFVKDKVIKLYL